jgi:hypothetical protein
MLRRKAAIYKYGDVSLVNSVNTVTTASYAAPVKHINNNAFRLGSYINK